MDHHDTDHRFTGLWQKLVVLTQPAVAIEPPQRPFHNPPLRDHLKAFGGVGPLANNEPHLAPRAQRPDPIDERPGIRAISPYQPQAREVVPEDFQQRLGTIPVLHTGRGDDDSQNQPEGID